MSYTLSPLLSANSVHIASARSYYHVRPNDLDVKCLRHFYINGLYYDISTISFESVVMDHYTNGYYKICDKFGTNIEPTYENITEVIHIMQGKIGGRMFYITENICYDISFPLDWAVNHIWFNGQKHLCGPSIEYYGCKNCSDYGSVNGVFISYCSNCADTYEYGGYSRGCGVLFQDDSIDIINAKQNMVGYCETATECFAFILRNSCARSEHCSPEKLPIPTLVPSSGIATIARTPTLLPNNDAAAEPPAKKPREFYTKFTLPPNGTTVEDLYEQHHSYKWGEHRNCLWYKLDVLYQVLYIDQRDTAWTDPYAEYVYFRLNILDELLDAIPRLQLRKVPKDHL